MGSHFTYHYHNAIVRVKKYINIRLQNHYFLFVCLWGDSSLLPAATPTPQWAKFSSLVRFRRSHTTTHCSLHDSSGRVISSSQRHLSDNTQHSQQTDICSSGGIRTHNHSKPAGAKRTEAEEIFSVFMYGSSRETGHRQKNRNLRLLTLHMVWDCKNNNNVLGFTFT